MTDLNGDTPEFINTLTQPMSKGDGDNWSFDLNWTFGDSSTQQDASVDSSFSLEIENCGSGKGIGFWN